MNILALTNSQWNIVSLGLGTIILLSIILNIIQAFRKSKVVDEYNEQIDEIEKLESAVKELKQQISLADERLKVAERFEPPIPQQVKQEQPQINYSKLVEDVVSQVLQKLQDLNKQKRGM